MSNPAAKKYRRNRLNYKASSQMKKFKIFSMEKKIQESKNHTKENFVVVVFKVGKL